MEDFIFTSCLPRQPLFLFPASRIERKREEKCNELKIINQVSGNSKSEKNFTLSDSEKQSGSNHLWALMKKKVRDFSRFPEFHSSGKYLTFSPSCMAPLLLLVPFFSEPTNNTFALFLLFPSSSIQSI